MQRKPLSPKAQQSAIQEAAAQLVHRGHSVKVGFRMIKEIDRVPYVVEYLDDHPEHGPCWRIGEKAYSDAITGGELADCIFHELDNFEGVEAVSDPIAMGDDR